MHPHQLSFAKQSGFKVENDILKVPKKAKVKKDVIMIVLVIIYTFNSISL